MTKLGHTDDVGGGISCSNRADKKNLREKELEGGC